MQTKIHKYIIQTRIQVNKKVINEIKGGTKIIRVPINRWTSTSNGNFFTKKFWGGHDFSQVYKDSLYCLQTEGNYEYLHVAFYHPEEPCTEDYKYQYRIRCAAEPGSCIFYRKRDNFGLALNVKTIKVDIDNWQWIIELE